MYQSRHKITNQIYLSAYKRSLPVFPKIIGLNNRTKRNNITVVYNSTNQGIYSELKKLVTLLDKLLSRVVNQSETIKSFANPFSKILLPINLKILIFPIPCRKAKICLNFEFLVLEPSEKALFLRLVLRRY